MTDQRWLRRRKILQMAGLGATAGITGLAGCFGNGGNGNGGNGNGGNGNGNGGGGQGTEDPADLPPVHVFTDYNSDSWQKYWKKSAVPKFEEETGIGIKMEYAGFQGKAESRLSQLIQSGSPPAIVSGAVSERAQILARGGLLPVDDTLSEITDVLGDPVQPPLTLRDGNKYSIPHGNYIPVLSYRKDIYDELGLSPPSTWDEWIENARAIDEAENIESRGTSVMAAKNSSDLWFQSFLNRNGATMFQWKSDAQEEVELWFPKKESIEVLEFAKELAKYSPDPSSAGWGNQLKWWASGRVAQMYHMNLWGAGVAASAGAKQAAKNSRATPAPRNDIPPEETYVGAVWGPNGYQVLKNSANPRGAKEFLSWVYGRGVEEIIPTYAAEPMRFFPGYKDITTSDAYKNIDFFKEYPMLLEENKKMQNEIVPNHFGFKMDVTPDNAVTMATVRPTFLGQMMNDAVVVGRDPEKAYEDAYAAAEERLAEVKEQLNS